jgi:glycosyltransferase involved in cell wall biosynthesis
LRILHVNKFLYRRGGSEGYMLDVAGLQSRSGDEVALWGMQHPQNDEPQLLAHTFPSYLELEPVPSRLKAVSAAGRMIWSTTSEHGMQRALEEFQPDIVHCHNIFHHLSPSILRPISKAKIPCVMTLHDYKLACPSYQMLDHGNMCHLCVTGGTWHAVKQRCKGDSVSASTLLAIESGIHRAMNAYASVGIFISPSEFLANVMRQSGIPADKLRVVRHFVDNHSDPPDDKPRCGVLFAGRLAAEKGVDTLIKAAQMLPDGVRIDIAGEGPLRDSLERLAADKAPGRVTFHGRLDMTALKEIFSRSIASVVPSRWYENQPMTILESFAFGVPVVASDLGGIPELIHDNVEGFLVPYNDPPALAAALTQLLIDPSRARTMGFNGLNMVRREFSPLAHLTALYEVYAEAGRRRSSGDR